MKIDGLIQAKVWYIYMYISVYIKINEGVEADMISMIDNWWM